MFNELIKTLEEHGRGLHACRKAADLARKRIASEPDRAAAWLLLASISELIVEHNERMAVSVVESNQWFSLLKGEVEQLNTAFAVPDSAGRLSAINQTAQTLLDQETRLQRFH